MNPTKVLPIVLMLVMAMIVAACGPTPTPAPAALQAALPNPASEFCEANGGRLEIRTAADGSQSGVCVFADGSECDEWAFFRGECASGGAAGTPQVPAPDSMTAAASLALQVLLPEDGSQIDIEQCQVIGITAPGAVVTINDEIVIAGADGSFQATIALERIALRKALVGYYPRITHFNLSDYKVRILDSDHGTEAITRVLIDTRNDTSRCSTVGAGTNIIEASWRALADSMEYGLMVAH